MKDLFLHREEIDVYQPHCRRPRGNLRQRTTKPTKRNNPPHTEAFGFCCVHVLRDYCVQTSHARPTRRLLYAYGIGKTCT